jgi:PadR family transcriptional regulator, regulatory protein PadR
MEELKRHGYDISPGTLYPVLHQMEAAAYPVRADRVVIGKFRKYFAATDQGQQLLAEARLKIAELVGEVVEGHGPSSIVMDTETQ